MSFLAPAFFLAALGVAAGAIALHFIVTRQPSSSHLPTVRFIPQGSVETVTITRRPEDVLLLLLRVLLILLIGAAFARPILVTNHRPVARIVLADVSRQVGSVDELRDSVRAVVENGDVLIIFDTSARVARGAAVADTLAALTHSDGSARLSTALVAALRTASEMRAQSDSLELVIVSPFAAEAIDAATPAIRDLWPGRARLVQLSARRDSARAGNGHEVRGASRDPMLLASAAPRSGAVSARIVRSAAENADSIWATQGGRTLVRWPAEGAPPGWVARETIDTAGAVVSEGGTIVAPFERRWRLDSAAQYGRVVARWVDGEPAAVERVVGDGCIRDVAIPVPERGDLVLRPAFRRFVESLAQPCHAAGAAAAMAAIDLDMLASTGDLAPTARFAVPDTIVTPLVPWLIAAAIVLALIELLLRRRRRAARTARAGDAPETIPTEVAA